MPKMDHYGNKFLKISQRPLIFNIGELKLCDLAKLFFQAD